MRGIEVDIRFAGASYVDVIVRSDKEADAKLAIEMLDKHLAKLELSQNCEPSMAVVGDHHDRDPGHNPIPMVILTKAFSCLREDFRKVQTAWTKELHSKFGKNLSVALPQK